MKYAVYGTLRLNQGNYRNILENNSKYIETKKVNGFEMFSLGGFPGVVKGNGKITVDVFEVSSKQVESRLDSLEGYSEYTPESSMYLKKKLDSGEFIYVWNGPKTGKTIKNGDWLDYKYNKNK